ncbi:RING finger protein 141 [Camelus dromedarius]|nr:RING finger protein 141 [Camelus dromedarius]
MAFPGQEKRSQQAELCGGTLGTVSRQRPGGGACASLKCDRVADGAAAANARGSERLAEAAPLQPEARCLEPGKLCEARVFLDFTRHHFIMGQQISDQTQLVLNKLPEKVAKHVALVRESSSLTYEEFLGRVAELNDV